jgi:hypothetical protein
MHFDRYRNIVSEINVLERESDQSRHLEWRSECMKLLVRATIRCCCAKTVGTWSDHSSSNHMERYLLESCMPSWHDSAHSNSPFTEISGLNVNLITFVLIRDVQRLRSLYALATWCYVRSYFPARVSKQERECDHPFSSGVLVEYVELFPHVLWRTAVWSQSRWIVQLIDKLCCEKGTNWSRESARDVTCIKLSSLAISVILRLRTRCPVLEWGLSWASLSSVLG